MDENFLIAFVHEIHHIIPSEDLPFIHIWNRKENYSSVSLRLETNGNLGFKFAAPFNVCNVPLIHQGVLTIAKEV